MPAVRDVFDLGDEVHRLALLVADQRHREVDPDDVPVGVEVALLHRVAGDLALEGLPHEREVGVEVLRVGDVLERRAEQTADRVADTAGRSP